jgi:hypothetical protein
VSRNMTDPLEIELQETNRYFLQIESTMHDAMKFYSTLVLGVMTASIALASMEVSDAPLSLIATRAQKMRWLGFLWLVFTAIGYLTLLYFLELRIRKVKMIDRLSAIRDYLAAREHGSAEALLRNQALFITGVRRAPPYLRRPCGEWYLMLYLCILNATGFAFFVWAFQWLVIGWLVVIGVTAFLAQFWTVTAWAFKEDTKRSQTFGESEYSFLPHREVPALFKVFNGIAMAIEVIIRWMRRR